MSFKNAVSISAIVAVGSYIANQPHSVTGSFALATFTTILALPTIKAAIEHGLNELPKIKDQAAAAYKRARAKSVNALDFTKTKSKDFAWAITNPDQNVLSGAGITTVAGMLFCKLATYNQKTTVMVTAGSALAGAVTGHYLPNSKLKKIGIKCGLVAAEKRSLLAKGAAALAAAAAAPAAAASKDSSSPDVKKESKKSSWW
jgi:hypothetical protein